MADSGFNSQGNHEALPEELGIKSIIPPRASRPTARLPTGRWRCEMAVDFNEETYGQPGQVETVMFMLKRHQTGSLTPRKHQTRRRAMGLMAATHNVTFFYV